MGFSMCHLTNGVVSLLVIGSLVLFVWILVDEESSPTIYDGNDKVSTILIKDMGKGAILLACELMFCILYIQWKLKRYYTASVFATTFAFCQYLTTTFHQDDERFEIFKQASSINVVVSSVMTLILSLTDNTESSLWLHVELKYKWEGTAIQKTAAVIFAVSIIIYIVWAVFAFVRLVFQLDGYLDESAGARDARNLSVARQCLFGLLLPLALIVIGPAVFSLGVITVSYGINIFCSWRLFGELKAAQAPLNVMEDYLSGLVWIHLLVPFLMVGLVLQSLVSPTPRAEDQENVSAPLHPSVISPLLAWQV